MNRKLIAGIAAVVIAGTGIGIGLAVTSSSAPVHSARHVVVLPAGINTTCKSDDTKALESYFTSLPVKRAGIETVVNFGSDCLQVDGTIWIRGFKDLTITGGRWEQATPVPGDTAVRNNPATAPYCGKQTYRDASYSEPTSRAIIMFWFEGGCDITLSHMTIVGMNPGTGGGLKQEDTFIQFNGTQRALVDDVTMKGPYGDYVDASSMLECGNCGYSYPATDITVENSSFKDSGRQGIGFINAVRMWVTHNTFYSAADTMFDIEVDSLGGIQWDFNIADNKIVGQHYADLVAAGTGALIERFQFSGNQMIDGGQMRIYVSDGEPGNNIRIDYNRATAVNSSSGFSRPAIFMRGVFGPTVAVDHNWIPVGKAGLAVLPKGATVCEQVCPPIHITGPFKPVLP